MQVQEAQDIVSDICKRMKIYPCVVHTTKQKRALYYPGRALMKINPQIPYASGEFAIIHELAHHVSWAYDLTRQERSCHGRKFIVCLLTVIDLYKETRNPEFKYNWEFEYKTIQKLNYRYAWKRLYQLPYQVKYKAWEE